MVRYFLSSFITGELIALAFIYGLKIVGIQFSNIASLIIGAIFVCIALFLFRGMFDESDEV
jgi:hypothetical protein